MLPEDEKRLEREADIAKATRGPDYRDLETSIARNKAAAANRTEAANETASREAWATGYKRMLDRIVVPHGPDPDRSDDRSR